MKLYIAYGSNLNLEQMKYRCPNSKPIGTAMLQDYELEFRGVATIVPKKGVAVPVLLWQISPQDERNLDRYEGFPNLYRKETYEIELDRHKVSGMAYVMNGGQIAAPNIHYYCTIAQGYRENHLNLEYLNAAVERAAEFQNNLIETDDFQMDLT
ncbi:MAG: gamma-glutamylcyclotransferase [Oscillospiraceae bacterium]|nr:gamma-glutamylcyclotransferase [Oscillospiraceae bacterium]